MQVCVRNSSQGKYWDHEREIARVLGVRLPIKQLQDLLAHPTPHPALCLENSEFNCPFWAGSQKSLIPAFGFLLAALKIAVYECRPSVAIGLFRAQFGLTGQKQEKGSNSDKRIRECTEASGSGISLLSRSKSSLDSLQWKEIDIPSLLVSKSNKLNIWH